MHYPAILILIICGVACAPPKPPAGGPPVTHREKNWNKAREAYFHSTKSPSRQYAVDGVTGETIDVHVYPSPKRHLVVVTFGETYFNTTGHDVHVALMNTRDGPTYPGNVYLCPNGFEFALDWINDETLAVFYPAGYYPDQRDTKTGAVSKHPNFRYERKVAGITVKFIPTDSATMDAKQEAMVANELRAIQ